MIQDAQDLTSREIVIWHKGPIGWGLAERILDEPGHWGTVQAGVATWGQGTECGIPSLSGWLSRVCGGEDQVFTLAENMQDLAGGEWCHFNFSFSVPLNSHVWPLSTVDLRKWGCLHILLFTPHFLVVHAIICLLLHNLILHPSCHCGFHSCGVAFTLYLS